MKTLTRISLVLVVAAALAACGLIPDQTVNNPFGLDGQSITITIGAAPAALITPQATGSGTVTTSFEDISTPVSPGSISVMIPFAGTATVTASSGPQPPTVTLDSVTLDVTVSDANGSASFTLSPTVSATLTQTSGTNYSIDSLSVDGSLSASEVSQLNSVITGGGTNTATVTVTVNATSTPDLPAGSTIAMTFGSTSAIIGF